MNIAEKILAAASGREEVKPGEIVEAKVDMAMANEITGPLAIQAFKKIGAPRVWDRRRIVLVLDHQVPADSVRSAELHKIMRTFAKEQRIPLLYDIGYGGVCHQVMVEKGHVKPGKLIVGADSHTCTYGALGAFGTGIGSTEMAGVFATGEIWLRVPSTIRIDLSGSFLTCVAPKDVILYVIGKIGADGATYKAIEFTGTAIHKISVSGRMTLCNMTVEMGAKTGIISPDEVSLAYVESRTDESFMLIGSDSDAVYEKTLAVDIEKIEPQVACPHAVDNVKPVKEVEGVEINQAFIGSCTNGRLEDLKIAAKFLKGKKIAKGVRLIVTPASQEIYLQALQHGLLEVFVKSGAYVCNPTCGACFGGHMGLLASGEVCISSSNRNFVGRMGSPEAEIYLASPATVAASALAGKIVDPRRFSED
ncbi:3-isopropylmalate dehydratase large subunit [Candidatus Bathyarchaeota archaeon ex4484_231]|nr:MAG: 3-isopropylmalate dehydratase large subunit [Candidatus Bathyarchaeota archaeon ex4484_231]RJS75748.1 MAG: 3-isopropylmalate dehydratase large subunit [Candidatus Bathyarchaeota archaeon]